MNTPVAFTSFSNRSRAWLAAWALSFASPLCAADTVVQLRYLWADGLNGPWTAVPERSQPLWAKRLAPTMTEARKARKV